MLPALIAHAVDLRRALHRRPELMWAEHGTAATVRAELDRLGITWRACATTGTVARLGGPGPAIAFRADLDALPLQELTGLPYASEHAGCMHACGHDGHTASLLGAAAWLKAHEAQLPQPIVLIFQPAEEGGHGAAKMITDGALTDVYEIYGYHNWPPLPFGKIACPLGPVMAANSEWTVEIFGRGGHASAPHDGVDPLVTAAMAVTAMQHIVSRNIAPQEAAVVTVTCFQAGTPPADNIIPDSALLVGTVRAGTTEQRDALAKRVEAVVAGLCAATGATYTFDYRPCYPATVNHAVQAQKARAVICRVCGDGALHDAGMPLMAAEDFGAFLRERPGAFLLLGAGRPGQSVEGCHSPRFDFNDELIPVVVQLWAHLAGVPVPLSM